MGDGLYSERGRILSLHILNDFKFSKSSILKFEFSKCNILTLNTKYGVWGIILDITGFCFFTPGLKKPKSKADNTTTVYDQTIY